MTNEEKLKYCTGCDDDFYNGKNELGIQRCWGLETATRVVRYKLHWWTAPTVPGAFTEIITNSCHTERGKYAFYKELPSFAVDVRKDYVND